MKETKYCTTCVRPVEPSDYLRVRTEEEGPRGPLYYCNRECLYAAARYAPELFNRIRSVSRKGGARRGEAV